MCTAGAGDWPMSSKSTSNGGGTASSFVMSSTNSWVTYRPSDTRARADRRIMADRTPSALTAAQLGTAYRAGELSPVEATRASLDAIAARDPTHNAYVLVDPEAALEQARAAERRWHAGTALGPLDGVPASIKDMFLSAGWPTLRGSACVDANQPWEEDSPVTARMRENGLVLLGKTTTPELGWK